jgi:hypothetical protein
LGTSAVVGRRGAYNWLEAARGDMTRKPRTDIELYEASGRVEYEITQLNDCIYRLAMLWLEDKDKLLYNSLITAFVTHMRNVYIFFYDNSSDPSDILALDFLITLQLGKQCARLLHLP